MKVFSRRQVIVGVAMFLAAGLSLAITPTRRASGENARIDLEKLVPQRFGEWDMDPAVSALVVSPDVQAVLDKIYSQTLARTYRNASGQRVMLSVAYGSDQSDGLRVHKPEICYTAQGFQIIKEAAGEMLVRFGVVPVKRLVASQGSRVEPITYWIMVGQDVARNDMDFKLKRMRYGLTGEVPDGMLVRVSSLGRDDAAAYAVHDQFSKELLDALGRDGRVRLFGASAR